MYFCYACGKQLNLRGIIDRESICPSCQTPIHCCFNCRFYDPGATDKCVEQEADFVSDKSKANFCGYYVIKENEFPPVDHDEEVRKAKAKLDALFGKQD